MAPGFLAVLSEPGDKIPLYEFHDWYNNEHIPLRLNHLSSFLSGARYRSMDGIKPSWIAVYEVDDTKTFQDESYTVLRETRSEREIDILERLEGMDRRTCEVVKEVGEAGDRTTGLKVGSPTRWVVTHGVDRPNGSAEINKEEDEDEVVRWIDEIVAKLEKSSVEGWVRSKVLKVLESGKTGVNFGLANEGVPSYFIFHEFASQESANSSTFREIIEEKSESSLQITEFRRWELYKSYPCIAQGNVKLRD